MTKDDVIRLAESSGFSLTHSGLVKLWLANSSELEAFAKLVAEHEREACARVCELMWHEWLDSPEENEPNKPDAEDCYRAIRARP